MLQLVSRSRATALTRSMRLDHRLRSAPGRLRAPFNSHFQPKRHNTGATKESKESSIPISAILGITAISAGVAISSDDDARAKARNIIKASLNIANLISTVGVILIDYAITIQFIRYNSKGLVNEEELTISLKKYQSLQEEYTINQILATKDNKIDEANHWKQLIKDTRVLIDDVSDKLSKSHLVDNNNPYSAVHSRSGKRLKEMCEWNKGMYIKLGQHLSMLDYVIPTEYQDELCHLLSNTPRTTYDGVRRIIKADLGKYPEELFDSFAVEPIASASLAQVHIGYKDNKKYAVKIQHEGLLESSRGDMYVIEKLIHFISALFPSFNYDWLIEQIKENLPKELDFNMEANNIERTSQLLHNLIVSGDLAVPAVNRSMSSKRVLTMSFEEGCYVSDLDNITKNLHLNTSDVARVISTIFCEQIYRHGVVHCDPHEANILVRKNPLKPNQPQIVLLDHGLYQDLGDEFRLAYCKLWQSIILADENGIKSACNQLNAGIYYTLFAAILTLKPWDDIVNENNDVDRLKAKGTAGEKEMLKAYAQKYFKDISILLRKIPRKLLLVLKTNDCLRHLDKKLGAPINSTIIVAKVTSEELSKEGGNSNAGLSFRLLGMYVMSWYLSWFEKPK